MEVLARLRHDRLVGGHDQQHGVDPVRPGEHVADEALVAGDVDERQRRAVGQEAVREAQVDRDPALPLLLEAIGIGPGQRLGRARSCRDRCGRRSRRSVNVPLRTRRWTPLAAPSARQMMARGRRASLFQLGRLLLVALTSHERVGGDLAGLDARLVEGVDAVQLARKGRLELEQVDQLAEDVLVDLGQDVGEVRDARPPSARSRCRVLGAQQLAERVAAEVARSRPGRRAASGSRPPCGSAEPRGRSRPCRAAPPRRAGPASAGRSRPAPRPASAPSRPCGPRRSRRLPRLSAQSCRYQSAK